MAYNIKLLEVKLDGNRVGTIHLSLDGTLKVAKVKLDKIAGRISRDALFNTKADYGFTYRDYINTVKNCIRSDFPASRVAVNEKRIDPKIAQLYGRYLSGRA